MPKLITFNVPTSTKGARKPADGQRQEKGYIVQLELAPGLRHKFVMQLYFTRPTILTDYRTGMRLGSFAGIILSRYVARPYAYNESISSTYRKVAQEFLSSLVAQAGLAKVQEELAKHPTLNP